MKCRVTNEKNGTVFTYGILNSNERIKVISGHLFYNMEIEVEKYDNDFYIPSKLNYDENELLSRFQDKDGLIEFSILQEVKSISTKGKRIFELDGFYLFVPLQIIYVVEYLYEKNLINSSKIKLTRSHTINPSSAPIINVNYDKMFEKIVNNNIAMKAHFYSEEEKNFEKGVYADFFVLGTKKSNEIQFELWQIIDNGDELFYSHFIKDLNKMTFKHFDLATHIKSEDSNIDDLLNNKLKPNVIQKIKWFRNDNDFSEKQIFEITKLFFPLDDVFDEFIQKNYV